MQQRVGVVRALANEPDVLLMDEPFASVDAQTRMTLQEELTRIWQEKRPTVLFITHDVAEAVFLANRVVVLSKGRVLERDRRRPAAAAVVGRADRGRAVQGADRPGAATGALGMNAMLRVNALEIAQGRIVLLAVLARVYLGVAAVADAGGAGQDRGGLSSRAPSRSTYSSRCRSRRSGSMSCCSRRYGTSVGHARQRRSKCGE